MFRPRIVVLNTVELKIRDCTIAPIYTENCTEMARTLRRDSRAPDESDPAVLNPR